MNRSIKFRVLLAVIAFIVVMTSILSINAAAETITQNSSIAEQKIYANANINDYFADDAVLVMFNNEVSLECNTFNVKDFDEVKLKNVRNLSSLTESRVVKAKDNIVRSVTKGESFVLDSGLDLSEFNQVFRLELVETGKDKVLEAIEILEKRDDILYVGPDYILEYCSDMSGNTDYYDEMSYLSTFVGKWAAEQILLGEAQSEISTASDQRIRVAVIDTGIDSSHDALDHGIVNTDDSDTYGNNCSDGATVDAYGHGTNVAGIIFGVAENVELISFKTSDGGYALSSAAYLAIQAVSNSETPIPIMNFGLIWKVDQGAQTDEDGYNAILTDALRDFDGLVVCPAGNNGVNIDNDSQYDYYPVQHTITNMIVVGASTQGDGVKSDSNRGAMNVDVFAPGELIYTINKDGGYHTVEKTSYAAPFVTGLAAMLLMVNDELEAEELIEIIKDTVDTAYTDDYIEGVSVIKGSNIQNLYSACSSHGRINAYKAVLMAETYSTCDHTGDVTYGLYNSDSHRVWCDDCDELITIESHECSYTSYGASEHRVYCNLCAYDVMQDHNLYVHVIYGGDDGCNIACRDCSYNFDCDCNPEYGSNDNTGHTVDCPEGNFSFFEEHDWDYEEYSVHTHKATCTVCRYVDYQSHSWFYDGTKYICRICGEDSYIIPGEVMSLSDEELELLISSLSEEELAEFIASLPEDAFARVTAILPPVNDDELLTE